MAVDRRFDDVLMTMAGQAGSLEALLSIFFAFLHRNTDFYVTFDPDKTTVAGMGFPPGKAENLLLRAFRSLPYKPYTDPSLPPSSSSKLPGASAAGMQRKQQLLARPAASNNPIKSAVAPTPAITAATATPVQHAPPPGADKPSKASRETPTTSCSTADASVTTVAPSSSVAPTSPLRVAEAVSTIPVEGEVAVAGGMRVRYTEDGKQVPIGNGGVTPRYYWTQTITEATVYVDVPEGTRSKDVCCVIEPRRLRLSVRGAGVAAGLGAEEGDIIINGEMPTAVSREDSMWSLSDGKSVVISLEKTKRSWWQNVVEGDPEIDTTKVRGLFFFARVCATVTHAISGWTYTSHPHTSIPE